MTDYTLTTTFDRQQSQHKEDNDLQRVIELSLNDAHANHIRSADALIFEESKILVEGFAADMPPEMMQLCFCYFYVEISIQRLLEESKDTELGLRLIFRRICSVEYNKSNIKTLKMVLTHWRVQQAMEAHRAHIMQCVFTCIRIDNVGILRVILRCLYNAIYDDDTPEHDSDDSADSENEINSDNDSWDGRRGSRMNEVIKYMNYSAQCGAFKCLELLLQNPLQIDWSNELLNPVVLYNAVKYECDNVKLMHFIVDCLEMTGIRFVCDDVMEEVIRYDVMPIGRRIVSNGWHQINEYDVSFAKYKDLKCHEWITQRTKAYDYYQCVNEYGSEYDEW